MSQLCIHSIDSLLHETFCVGAVAYTTMRIINYSYLSDSIRCLTDLIIVRSMADCLLVIYFSGYQTSG